MSPRTRRADWLVFNMKYKLSLMRFLPTQYDTMTHEFNADWKAECDQTRNNKSQCPVGPVQASNEGSPNGTRMTMEKRIYETDEF